VGTSEFFFGDKVPFSASDSGSLQKYTNQSQSLPHFVAQKNFTGGDFILVIASLLSEKKLEHTIFANPELQGVS
jgi:hypothetical protein